MHRRQFLKTALVGAVAAAPVARLAAATEAAATPSARKLPRWRGFNLLEKFQVATQAPYVESDFQWMADWGFDFVRLPLDYRCWTDPKSPDKFDERVLDQIDEAVEFVNASGADLLAISIGTEHGVSKGRTIQLRVDLAQAIQTKLRAAGLDTPLVLHGSSGLLLHQVKDAIRYGICKLNKDTHYQYVYSRTACEFYVKNAAAIVPPAGVEDDVVDLFSKSDWSPNKKLFDPRVAGRAVQERIKWIAGELLAQAGSAGHAQAIEGTADAG